MKRLLFLAVLASLGFEACGSSAAQSAANTQLRIYWANLATGTIGRANLDGTGTNQRFVTGIPGPCDVDVNRSHVYWADAGDVRQGYNGTTIGRANLDGSGVNQSFITGANVPDAVAVNRSYIYWTNQASGTIGRANLDGTGVNQMFITGAPGPADLVVDSAFVYWANYGYPVPTLNGTTIGRARLDGTQANESFITGAAAPSGLAIQT